MFSTSIVPDVDGQYRWSYDMKANNNNDMLFYSLKWLLCFTVPFTVAILVMCISTQPLLAVVFCVVFNAVLLSIPVLIYKVLHTSLSYRLSDEEIETWPKRRRDSGITPLKLVKQIHLFPERDLILLRCGFFGSVRVYAPKADLERLAELIRERAPEGTEFFK